MAGDWYKINRHKIGIDSDHLGSYIKDSLANILIGDYVGAAKNIYQGRKNRKKADELEIQRAKTISDLERDRERKRRIAMARLSQRGLGGSTLEDIGIRRIDEAYDPVIENVNRTYSEGIRDLTQGWKKNIGILASELLFNTDAYKKPGEFRNLGGISRDFRKFGNQIKSGIRRIGFNNGGRKRDFIRFGLEEQDG